MSLSTNKPEMFWIDLETTGLDSRTDVPLEIGIVLTDRYLEVVDYWQAVIMENDFDLDSMPDIVKIMHQRSGLLEDIAVKDFPLSRDRADKSIIQWLTERHGIEKSTLPMAGSSIGSLDRPFVQQHFPRLNEFLHYRNIDISSIKELARIWRPDLIEGWDQESGGKEAATHRVIDDCRNSIAEYKFYIQAGFINIPTSDYVKIK